MQDHSNQSWAALSLPLVPPVALIAITLVPAVRQNPALTLSLLSASACLLVWHGALLARCAWQKRVLLLDFVPRQQHYIQACAQGGVLLYWGYYWRPLYDSAHLIVAQILFAYGVEMLLSWTRRNTYRLGFAPVPVVFSINLFLWFKPEWFWLQFLMIATGFLAKELITWYRDGRRVHIFNPSAFPLAVFSLALILTGTSDLTRGEDIARTLNNAPDIYVFIFLIGLAGQFLFGVTTMTMAAVVAMYLAGLTYFALTGVYFFLDSYIPIAVFLGMHLLFTDPSTAPHSELGRVCFGVLYALSVIALYVILGHLGAPTFYDKLMAVPLMNLCVQYIDRIVASSRLRRIDPTAIAAQLRGRPRNLAYITVWAAAFVTLSAVDGVGDTHRGQWMPFWQQVCAEGRVSACRVFGVKLVDSCHAGSGWACNEYGILLGQEASPHDARAAFERACHLEFEAGCANRSLRSLETPVHASPQLSDYSVVVHTGPRALDKRSPLELYNAACMQGFEDACDAVRVGGGRTASGEQGALNWDRTAEMAAESF